MFPGNSAFVIVDGLDFIPDSAQLKAQPLRCFEINSIKPVATTIFGKTKRQWASVLYPRPIRFFHMLNTNAAFQRVVRQRFGGAKKLTDRDSLYRYLNSEVLQGVAIDYLEFGVWQGASMKRWCELNGNLKSRFYGFDSFEGLPEYWNRKSLKGAFSLQGVMPKIGDVRADLVKGLFQVTLPHFVKSFEAYGRTVVHIDCDLYSSTLFCLATLNHLLVPGTILIFDEFQDSEHEFSAFMDYANSFYKQWVALAVTTHCLQVALEIK
jgi:O-methyltransferase